MTKEEEHLIYLDKQKRYKRAVKITRFLILISIIVLWEISADLKWIDPFLTSSPSI